MLKNIASKHSVKTQQTPRTRKGKKTNSIQEDGLPAHGSAA